MEGSWNVDGVKLFCDHSFKLNRFFTKTDYCTIYRINKQSSFKVKLAKPKNFFYFFNENLDKYEITVKQFLTYRFTVDSCKNISI